MIPDEQAWYDRSMERQPDAAVYQRIPVVGPDPELERMLREEEEIELRHRESVVNAALADVNEHKAEIAEREHRIASVMQFLRKEHENAVTAAHMAYLACGIGKEVEHSLFFERWAYASGIFFALTQLEGLG